MSKKEDIREDSFLAKDRVISMVADCRVPIFINEEKNWEHGSQLQKLKIPKFELDN